MPRKCLLGISVLGIGYRNPLILLCLLSWVPVGNCQHHGPIASPIDPCYQDTLLCREPNPPKLHVRFGGRRIHCDEVVSRDEAIHAPEIHFRAARRLMIEVFLLIMIDPDAPYPCAPPDVTMEHILHYVTIVTWWNGKLIPIRDILNYHPPAPPRGTHRYQFYLYPWSLSRDPYLYYNSPNKREGFNRAVFQHANQLGEPVAVFQFRSEHHVDLYLYTFIIVASFLLFELVVAFIVKLDVHH